MKQTPLTELNMYTSTDALATETLQYNILLYFNNTYIKNMKLSLYKSPFNCIK